MQYRSEIDGLRALAIVPVVLFHAGFSAFAAGYRGVDVFFVVSGYLITSLLHEQICSGSFSFGQFYERRARRLFPALFVVALVSIPFAWAWIPPDEFIEYSQSLIAMTLFIANVFFHAQSGYFDTAAELKPFLHTWSLSVEEQYYFIFPLLLWLLLKAFSGRNWLLVLSLAVASFMAAHAVQTTKPGSAFFLFHCRAWELLVGSACALWGATHRSVIDGMSVKTRNGLAAIGLTLVVLALLTPDMGTQNPEILTWVSVLGAALVLLFCTSAGLAGQVLGCKPMVGVGLVSYGAYLWHQPVFALARQRQFSGLDMTMAVFLLVLVFVLAKLSLELIERPIRDGKVLPGRRIFYFWGVGSLTLLALGAVGMEKEGWSARFNLPPSVQLSLTDHSPRGMCDAHKDANGLDASVCRLGIEEESGVGKIAVFGDSHAFPIMAAFDAPARELGLTVLRAGMGGCLPLIGANVVDGPNPFSSCAALAERQVAMVRREKVSQVFLISRWSLYTSEGYAERKMYHVAETTKAPRTLRHSLVSFEKALAKTVAAYREAGAQVILVSQLPQQITHPLSVYYKLYSKSFQGDAQIAIDYASIDRARHLSIQRQSRLIFDGMASLDGNVKHLVLDDVYCTASKCRMGTPSNAYYSDTNHISTDGALLAQGAFRQAMKDGLLDRSSQMPVHASP